MHNEINSSNEVSWSRISPGRASSNGGREGDCWKWTGASCPLDRLRGRWKGSEKASDVDLVPPSLVHREKIGNASNAHTMLCWSPPCVACKPIMPTPTVMRPHRTWWASRRGKARRHAGKRKDLDVLLAPVGHPGAAKCSPSHIHPPDRSEQDRFALNRHRCR